MNNATQKPSLRKDPNAAKAVFEKLSASLEQTCGSIVDELSREGYDPAEVAWVLAQVLLASSLAVHMQAGVQLEQLVQQIRHNWQANLTRMPPPPGQA